jgi:uncharacterized heparinase superfamily protein
MRKLSLLLNTLRYLKWQQIYFRITRKFVKPKVTEVFQGPSPQRSSVWKHIALYDDKIDEALVACFLNHAKKLTFPSDWDNECPSKLWLYNLHYFEDLLSESAHKKEQLHRELLNKWVCENPVGLGNAWEPYPSSLRIVNILKAWLRGLELDHKVINSVFEQSSFLSNNLERHILGNHLFANLKALLFAGIIFENPRWSDIAIKGLAFEIPEQILRDGGHFELSPMYHALILVDMLDILNLVRSYPDRVQDEFVVIIEGCIPKMLVFMESMAHTDGGVSFFNDSVDGIAPSKDIIVRYARLLGIDADFGRRCNTSAIRVIDNVNSGYICVTSGKDKLIFDAASVGSDYIPAHAHADTLSFELSIGGQRVFVNSGVSEYGLSSKRLGQRKTASHNTVEVDGMDSSQVWSGFRVGKRAQILHRSYKICRDNDEVTMLGAHNGYKSLYGGCVHERVLKFGNGTLSVNDFLKGRYKNARARFHMHPDLEVTQTGTIFTIEGRGFIVNCDVKDCSARLVDSVYNSEFGITKANKVLDVDVNEGFLGLEFHWTTEYASPQASGPSNQRSVQKVLTGA